MYWVQASFGLAVEGARVEQVGCGGLVRLDPGLAVPLRGEPRPDDILMAAGHVLAYDDRADRLLAQKVRGGRLAEVDQDVAAGRRRHELAGGPGDADVGVDPVRLHLRDRGRGLADRQRCHVAVLHAGGLKRELELDVRPGTDRGDADLLAAQRRHPVGERRGLGWPRAGAGDDRVGRLRHPDADDHGTLTRGGGGERRHRQQDVQTFTVDPPGCEQLHALHAARRVQEGRHVQVVLRELLLRQVDGVDEEVVGGPGRDLNPVDWGSTADAAVALGPAAGGVVVAGLWLRQAASTPAAPTATAPKPANLVGVRREVVFAVASSNSTEPRGASVSVIG